MRLAYLASRDSIHTVRWVNAMADRGHEVHLVTMHPGGDPLAAGVTEHLLPFRHQLGYLLNVRAVRGVLKSISPDLLHVHYASGYGTLGRLSGFHPYVLSVYGADVYDFPLASRLTRWLLERNLRTPDWICSTSKVMAKHTHLFLKGNEREITVTPFGIDAERFRPDPTQRDMNLINVGIVKKLDHKYGIDVLIRTFAAVKSAVETQSPERARKLRLTIVGRGPDRVELESLVGRLGLTDVTRFTGRVPHDDVPTYLNQLDVYVAPSRMQSESFGVAVLEASACAVPVVVANVGGLPEVVNHGETGFIVEPDDVDGFASAVLRLIDNPDLRDRMGEAGRRYVLERYQWEDSVSVVEAVLQRVARQHGRPAKQGPPGGRV